MTQKVTPINIRGLFLIEKQNNLLVFLQYFKSSVAPNHQKNYEYLQEVYPKLQKSELLQNSYKNSCKIL